jgi:Putative Flp pilus-assembly TadE/G-like
MMLCKPSPRPGAVLAYVVPIIFAMFGLAALVIDLGNARLSQRRMQSAADAAAYEALRARDDPTIDATGRDNARRQGASNVVAAAFASAQPQLEMTGGIPTGGTDFHASQLIQFGDPILYTKGLQLNLANAEDGDIVSGAFNPDPRASHQENDDYSRADFTPASAGSLTASAVLVRLRQTGETSTAGESSAAAPVPIVFGRGSLLDPAFKAQGTKVRATAIAIAVPSAPAAPGTDAWTVGPPILPANSQDRVEGYAPIAFTTAQWLNWQVTTTADVTVDAAGNVTLTIVNSSKIITGTAFRADGVSAGKAISLGMGFGFPSADLQIDPTTLGSLPLVDGTATNPQFVLHPPILGDITNSASQTTKSRLIAFGSVMVTKRDSSGALQLLKLPQMIAARNASPRLARPTSQWSETPQLSDSEFSQALKAQAGLEVIQGQVPALLLVSQVIR